MIWSKVKTGYFQATGRGDLKISSLGLGSKPSPNTHNRQGNERTELIRALLGLVRPLPSAGGGGGGAQRPLPTISVTNRRGGTIQPALESPGRDISDEVDKFDRGSPVTSQVRSSTKCLTFPFNAFPPQNTENKLISSLWIDMIRVYDNSKHRP